MGQSKDGKAGREEMAGLIGGHCPQRPSPMAEGPHGNSGAGQGSLQSQSTTAQARMSQPEKNSFWRSLSKPSPMDQRKGTSVLPGTPAQRRPCRVLPLHDAKTISALSRHAHRGSYMTAGCWISSLRRVKQCMGGAFLHPVAMP